MRFKRSRFISITVDDRRLVDLEQLLRGAVRISHRPQLRALALSAGAAASFPLAADDVRVLGGVPAGEWTPAEELTAALGVDRERLEDLADQGLLLSDAERPERAATRAREEALEHSQWHPAAALYHGELRSLKGAGDARPLDQLAADSEARYDAFVTRFGPPPPAFHERSDRQARLPLPKPAYGGALYDVLRRRQTTRAFDRRAPLPLATLNELLGAVFGCHGTTRLGGGVTVLKRTSPSGGSLHPIEAYPVALNVEGVPCGIYHYNAEHHALDRVRALPRDAAEAWVVSAAAGQDYLRDAHAAVLLTARVYRNFWKYRCNSRTYAVVLMDAGHLSQTFYLVAADLGLGAVTSAALDAEVVEEACGLDWASELPLALCACGIAAADGERLALTRAPFEPSRAARD